MRLPEFTSPRERRLLLWAAGLLVAIYSTLGVARSVADALRAWGVLELAVSLTVLGILVALAGPWIRQRPAWPEVGTAVGILLACLLLFVRIDNPAERTHLVEYAVLAVLIHQALQERVRNGRPVPGPAVLVVGVTAVLGLADETIQFFLPDRIFDWQDVAFNALAGFMAISARLALRPVTGPGWRLWVLWVLAAAFGLGWPMDPSIFGDGVLVPLDALPDVRTPPVQAILLGTLATASLQALILRRYRPHAGLWLVSGVAIATVGFLVWKAGALDAGQAGLWATLLYGLAAGALQWPVLRTAARGAVWWPPACGAAWIVTLYAGDLAGPPGWAVYGVLTGAALVVLLRDGGGPDPIARINPQNHASSPR